MLPGLGSFLILFSCAIVVAAFVVFVLPVLGILYFQWKTKRR